MNKILGKFFLGSVVFGCLLVGQNVSAAGDYQKTKVSVAKEVCISYAVWGPAQKGNSGMFGKCSNDDISTKKIYLPGSNCNPGQEFTGPDAIDNKIKCTVNPGEFCVPQQYITSYGDTPVNGLYTDAECKNIKAGEKIEKQYCCDCTNKAGGKTNVTVVNDETPKCQYDDCVLKEGVCAGIKDLSEIKVAAKKILNPAKFSLGTAGVTQIIGKMIKFLLFPIGMFTMALYIWAGFLWMTAQGNSENVTKAKQILVWTTLGVVITLASYLIVDLVFSQIL